MSLAGSDAPTRTSLAAALRADPAHASELLLCCVLPNLADHASRWLRRGEGRDRPRSPTWTVRRSTSRARRDGAVTGSSFYIGMPAAMASIYCHQVLMILQLAALHGLDPRDPERAAEILVLRGRAPDLASARNTLAQLGRTAAERGAERQTVADTIRTEWHELPGRARKAIANARQQGLFNGIIRILGMVSYLVPVLGMPVWAASYARATRQLGKKALEFYGAGAGSGPDAAVSAGLAAAWRRLPLLPRHLLVGIALIAGLLTAAALLLLRAVLKHKSERIGLAFAGLFIATCYARLWWILRREPPGG